MTLTTLIKSAAVRLLPASIVDALHRRRVVAAVLREMRGAQKAAAPARPHRLGAPLYISLTSYPRRFETLHHTLRSLSLQSVQPDGILLWIAHDDVPQLPAATLSMTGLGVTIVACDDLRSFKKLVPALGAHPDAYLVTADDDVYYPPDWLETFTRKVDPAVPAILCQRAHRMRYDAGGAPLSYDAWEEDVQDTRARELSTDLVPVGVGGVLYPPGTLAGPVADRSLFEQLAPDTDDLWFYWMARLGHSRHRKVGGFFRQIHWPQTQRGRLYERNEQGGNDRAMQRLTDYFGPLGEAPGSS